MGRIPVGENVGGGGAVVHHFAAANESEKITFLLFSNFVASCNLCKSQMLICGPRGEWTRGARSHDSGFQSPDSGTPGPGRRPHNAEPPPY